MQTQVTVDVAAQGSEVFAVMADLSNYRELIPLVHSVKQVASSEPWLWEVELRAKVGPFARSKKLTMTRTVNESPNRLVFARHETDNRDHAQWTLSVDITDAGAATQISLHLLYGGRLWTGGVLEKILHDNIAVGAANLQNRFGSPKR